MQRLELAKFADFYQIRLKFAKL
ncbi:hypothetical protein XACJK48_9240007 [Xanthomonas citri pv. citri]|nr:hypothetical protein XAC902_1760001 [Xanthomonas citri pv. citri]CEE30300.1 hypothetical protein XAC2911_1610001 [Xanthomonas citri pv. citri]CEF22416.1 hypothetical protein XACJK2_1810009 [Xanthomonas citri pv. citri]CEH60279.1 hypothetical protein XACJK48_9240007 [Xanthomonas citri pv. citri]CEL49369.1 hypothetical protein XACJM35_2430001 [Xanthomonas citri pv. citri]